MVNFFLCLCVTPINMKLLEFSDNMGIVYDVSHSKLNGSIKPKAADDKTLSIVSLRPVNFYSL